MARSLEYIDPKEITIIGLDTDHGPEHPLYDERCELEPDESMIQNIMAIGIQEPVIVQEEAGKLYCVDGRQRVKAARVADAKCTEIGEQPVKVPVIKVQGQGPRLNVIMISANAIRFSDDLLTRAAKAQRLLDRMGDIDGVAIAFGKSVTTIRNWLTLNAADPAVHEAIRSEKISTQAGVELAKLPQDKQKEELEKLTRAPGKISESKAKAARKAAEAAEAAAEAAEEVPAEGDATTPEGEAVPADSEGAPVKTKKAKKAKKAKKNVAAASVEHTAIQSGIRRSWLRKALMTKVGLALKENDPDRWAILQWFAWGDQPQGAWFDVFAFDASNEMGDTGEPLVEQAKGE